MTDISRLIHTFTGFIKFKRFNEDEGSTKCLHFYNSYSARIPSTTTSLATYFIRLRINRDSGICTQNLPKL